MSNTKGMVLCATGKMGLQVCRALLSDGFTVYGTTRGSRCDPLKNIGAIPVICDYTKKDELYEVLKKMECKNVFMITDYFLAAKQSWTREMQQGKDIIDACVMAGCNNVIYASAGDCDKMGPYVKHLLAKQFVEKHLIDSPLPYASILRPVAFFENLDDPVNYNPLKKGQVKFLTDCKVKFVSTYDVGKAAARIFRNPLSLNRQILDAVSWEGTLAELAQALERISGTETRGVLSMPKWLRRILLNDLHYMCLYFETGYPGSTCDLNAFREWVPDAMTADEWFLFHEKYADGSTIHIPTCKASKSIME
jgi:uncharacterized protein YbjT (DUF2867 family)